MNHNKIEKEKLIKFLDQPIKSNENDEYERNGFVQQLSRTLVDFDAKASKGLVVGLCGEWGSGKSSLLNMLEENLKSIFTNEVVIVRFEPWLISSRDSLIMHFMSDLQLSILESKSIEPKLKKEIGRLMSKYDQYLDFGIDLTTDLASKFVPYGYLTKIAGKGLKLAKNSIKTKDKTLYETKLELESELNKIVLPIVVLIDEVDRLEDHEIFEIMRLVKAVANFPKISYLIAYDINRVIEVLGGKDRSELASEKGRSYLEKIVQFQVQIPALFEEEVIELVRLSIKKIVPNFLPSNNRYDLNRYSVFENIIIPKFIRTPRDVKRIFGTFNSLHIVMASEVNWIDLLGYSILLTKFPSTAELIRIDPSFFSTSFNNIAQMIRYQNCRSKEREEPSFQLSEKIGKNWENHPEAELIKFLFPRFSKDKRDFSKNEDHSEIQYERALYFLVRQGRPPGKMLMETVKNLFTVENDIESEFDYILEKKLFGELNYILSFFYDRFLDFNHKRFWCALISWSKNNNNYEDEIFETFRRAGLQEILSENAIEIVRYANEAKAYTFTAKILIHQIDAHKLFGERGPKVYGALGSKEDWKSLCLEIISKWKIKHLQSDWIIENLLEFMYVFIKSDLWDQECKDRLVQLIENKEFLEKFVLNHFSYNTSCSPEFIDKIVGIENLTNAIGSFDCTNEDINAAFKKALLTLNKG